MDETERLAVGADLAVCVVERVEQLGHQRDRNLDRRRSRDAASLAQEHAQIATRDVLHGDEVARTDATELVQLHDVAVLEHRRQLRLAHERAHEVDIFGQMRQQTLESDDALEAVEMPLDGPGPWPSRPSHRRGLERSIDLSPRSHQVRTCPPDDARQAAFLYRKATQAKANSDRRCRAVRSRLARLFGDMMNGAVCLTLPVVKGRCNSCDALACDYFLLKR